MFNENEDNNEVQSVSAVLFTFKEAVASVKLSELLRQFASAQSVIRSVQMYRDFSSLIRSTQLDRAAWETVNNLRNRVDITLLTAHIYSKARH